MKNSKFIGLFLGVVLPLGSARLGLSQTTPDHSAQADAKASGEASNSSEAAAKLNKSTAGVRSGTKVAAAMESTLDARTAKPGDEVRARVTKNVKQDGRIVVHKGDELIGHVTDVHASSDHKGGSSLGVQFDRLASGGSTSPLNAVMSSVFSSESQANGQSDSMTTEPMPMIIPALGGGGSGSARASGSASGGGGLLGGVGSTVNSTVGTVGSVAAPVVGGVGAAADTVTHTATDVTGQTLGQVSAAGGAVTRASSENNANAGLIAPLSSIKFHTESQGDQETGMKSVLSTRHGDLRLESGTRTQFKVKGDAESQKENE